jgi:nitrite reductase (NADH) large subunit
LVQLFDRGDLVPEDPLELLCQVRASAATTERVVCNCNKVTEQVLCDAIAAGADSTLALGDATRAGTGCGSCKGELAQLIAKHAKKPMSLPLLAAG